jgi:hypothetical protein
MNSSFNCELSDHVLFKKIIIIYECHPPQGLSEARRVSMYPFMVWKAANF